MPKTATPKPSTKQRMNPTRQSHTIDASTQTLGRLATHVAVLLRGKHKASYQPHLDLGDHVIISNAGKIKTSGQKLTQKVYKHHSGYPGGLKVRRLEDLLVKNPGWVIRQAVWNMLPKNKLRSRMIKRLTFSK